MIIFDGILSSHSLSLSPLDSLGDAILMTSVPIYINIDLSIIYLFRFFVLYQSSHWKSEEYQYYKYSWNIIFRYLETSSTLRFWNSKEEIRISFSGAKKFEKDTLAAINFLAMYKFLYIYNGVLAGASV